MTKQITETSESDAALFTESARLLVWAWSNMTYRSEIGWENNGAALMETVDRLRERLGMPLVNWNKEIVEALRKRPPVV